MRLRLLLNNHCCSDPEAQPNERFQGIDWTANQGMPCTITDSFYLFKFEDFPENVQRYFTEVDLTDEVEDEEHQQVPGQSTWTPQNVRHIDENDPARHSYHRYGLNVQAGLVFTSKLQ